jgi:hypothetical protein
VVAVVKRLKVLATCREIWKAVSLVTNRPEEWTYLPPLVIWFFTRTDVREYVPCSGQKYGHVVVLQTYVLHNGVRMVLQSLVVALIHELELWQNQPELHRLKYVCPLLRAPTYFKWYNPLACWVMSQ